MSVKGATGITPIGDDCKGILLNENIKSSNNKYHYLGPLDGGGGGVVGINNVFTRKWHQANT